MSSYLLIVLLHLLCSLTKSFKGRRKDTSLAGVLCEHIYAGVLVDKLDVDDFMKGLKDPCFPGIISISKIIHLKIKLFS